MGESRFFPAAEEAVIRIGSRGIIRAAESGEGIRVFGLKPGATTLIIDNQSHFVRVSLKAQKAFAENLRDALDEMMGLTLETDGKLLEVRGTLLRFSDWLRIAELASEFQGEFRFTARPLADVAEAAIRHLQKLAKERGIPIVRFSAAPRFTVHIPQSSRGLRDEVERVFKPFGIQVEVSKSDMTLEPLVRTKVILAEVSKSFSQEFGVSWPSEYSAQMLPKPVAGEGVLATLKALEADGKAQILASPTLLCRSGGEADFHAGGEFPIRITSRRHQDVQWKPHGVILKVKPRADYQGSISLAVETEISLLDMANAVDGVPALKKNSVKSHFDLPGKRTIALSGLLRQELGENAEGLPLLTRLPVLGALFSSRKYLRHQTELVVFVTPEIYSPDSDELIQMPEGWISDGL